jgi:hypothetical protein
LSSKLRKAKTRKVTRSNLTKTRKHDTVIINTGNALENIKYGKPLIDGGQL